MNEAIELIRMMSQIISVRNSENLEELYVKLSSKVKTREFLKALTFNHKYP